MARRGKLNHYEPKPAGNPSRTDASSNQRHDRAWRAVQTFKKMTPSLTSFARALTGSKVSVVASKNTATDGKQIFIAPPIELGDPQVHDRSLCEKRDPVTRMQLCGACAAREQLMRRIYHEIAHIVFQSTANPDNKSRLVVEALIHEWHPTGVCKHAEPARDLVYKSDSFLTLPGAFSPYLQHLVKMIEDARVDSRMYAARPGLKTPTEAVVLHMMTHGNTDPTGKHFRWMDAPLLAQIMIGIRCMGMGLDLHEEHLDPEALKVLRDPTLYQKAIAARYADSTADAMEISVDVFRYLLDMGVINFPKCEPPPPIPSLNKEPGDDSDDADPGEGSEGDGDSSDENSDGDSSDGSGDDSESGDSGSGDDDPEDQGNGEGSGSEGSDSDDSSYDNEDSTRDGDDQQDSSGDDPGKSGSASAGDADEVPDDGGESDPSDGADDGDAGDGKESGSDSGGAETGSSGSDDREPGSSGDEQDPDESGDSSDPGADDDGVLDGVGDGSGTKGEGPRPGDDDGADDGEDASATVDDLEGEDAPGPDGSDEGQDDDGPAPGDGVEDIWEVDYGTAEQVEAALELLDFHEHDNEEAIEVDMIDGELPDAQEMQASSEAVAQAVHQATYFDVNSHTVGGVVEIEYGQRHPFVKWPHPREELTPGGRRRSYGDDDFLRKYRGIIDDHERELKPPESILGPALRDARIVFSNNQLTKTSGNRKSGRVDARVLGRRAPIDDERLFMKRERPGRRSYEVLIGLDCSGSTASSERNMRIKRAAYTQAELLNRLGVPFSIYGHTGGLDGDSMTPRQIEAYYAGDASGHPPLEVTILKIKTSSEPWNEEIKVRLANMPPASENLDGHTLEYYRKAIARSQATNRIICYYTDGQMPAANGAEEAVILTDQLKKCREQNIVTIGVGINTDSPTKYGLDTVRVDSDEDLRKVVLHLKKYLA